MEVRLIDFAHCEIREENETQKFDEGFIFGLHNLLFRLYDIVDDLDHNRNPCSSSQTDTSPRVSLAAKTVFA